MLAATGETVQNVIIAASVGAIGALIAGLTALAQSWFAGRDARLRATAQLDLATRRTKFVAEYLDAHEKIGNAAGRLTRASQPPASSDSTKPPPLPGHQRPLDAPLTSPSGSTDS